MKLNHQAIGAFGERAVEAELLRRGWIPATDMTHRTRENFFAAEGRLVTIMGNTMPPRDPNDDDDDDEDRDNDTESDDEPPVVREPDEDE